MRRGLAGVEHGHRADLLRQRDEVGHRVHDAQHVRDVRERDDAGALADDGGRGIHVQRPVVVNGDVAQDGARAGGELLPRDEVRVVLGLGHHDLVAGMQRETSGCRGSAPDRRVADRVGHEVEPGGGAARPHQLLGWCADEAGDGGAGVFEELGRLGGEGVRAAVDGGVRPGEEVHLGVDDRLRLLARRARVEIDQALAVDALPEDREVRAECRGVREDGRRGCGCGSGHPSRLRGMPLPGAGPRDIVA